MDLLRQPYPAVTEPMHKLRTALVAGLVVGLFLFTFRPFGIDAAVTQHEALFIWGYGLVTSVVLAVLLFALPVVLPNVFVEERWTVGKNIAFFMVIVFAIGSANLYYTHVAAGMPLSLRAFLSFQLYTASVSIVVASAATFIRYATNLKRYQREAIVVNHEIVEHRLITKPEPDVTPQLTEPAFTIRSENDKEVLTLTADSLLYIESADNYSKVCFLENGFVEHRLIRSSLKRIEDNLSQPFCFRCHRSYIVNLNKASHVTGNSQGYKLHLNGADKPIPVARRMNDALVDRIRSRDPRTEEA